MVMPEPSSLGTPSEQQAFESETDAPLPVIAGGGQLPAPTFGSVLLAFALALFVPFGFLVVTIIVATVLGSAEATISVSVMIASALMLVGMWWVIRKHLGWGWREVGFVRPCRSLWHLLWETPLLVIVSGLIAAGVGYLLGIDNVSGSEDLNQNTFAGLENQPLLLAIMIVVIVVIAPLVEEILFRRLLVDSLRARWSAVIAILVSGVLFGLMHVAPPAILFLVPLGMGLALVRIWHESLWASLVVHVVNNAFVTTTTLLTLLG